MRTLLAALLAVNTAFIPMALAEEPGEREWCYILVGTAFVEDRLINSMVADEEGFVMQLNEEAWEGTNDETKQALRHCLDLFINVKPTTLYPEEEM